MEEKKKISKSVGEEPKGAAYSSNSNCIAMKPPPYKFPINYLEDNKGMKSASLKAPVSPHQKYYIENGKAVKKNKLSALESRTPKNETAEEEKKIAEKEHQSRLDNYTSFKDGKNNHLAELNQTNNSVGSDTIDNQYLGIMNPIENSMQKAIGNTKLKYDDSADRDQAVMASLAVYGGEDLKYSPTEWETSDLYESILNSKLLANTGFKCQLFVKEELNKKNVKEKRYMLAFAGTEDALDWGANYNESKGQSAQHQAAATIARVLANTVGGADKIIFVGHSLGGGLASAAAYATGSNAITFNAAAVHLPTKLEMLNKYKDINFDERESNINAYINAGEILDIANRAQGLKADGNIKYVKKKGDSPFTSNAASKHGAENFLDIFNIDVQKCFQQYYQKENKMDVPEDFVDEYKNQDAPTHYESITDYTGAAGVGGN